MAFFETAIKKILKNEGGYVEHPADPGGATKYGVSLRFLKLADEDLNSDGNIDKLDVLTMTPEQASDVYKVHWWDKYRYGEINYQAVATKVFDFSVNAGPRKAHKFLQKSANKTYGGDVLIVDGIIGKKTLLLVNQLSAERILKHYRRLQDDFYTDLVKKNPDLNVFLRGWIRRVYSC